MGQREKNKGKGDCDVKQVIREGLIYKLHLDNKVRR